MMLRFDDPDRPSIRREFAVDGERIYFTLAEHESDVWMLELEKTMMSPGTRAHRSATMGWERYRSKDTELGRDVAIQFLPRCRTPRALRA